MKIYTRTGDSGETGLYGTVDELNCTLGAVRATLPPSSVLDPVLAGLQSDLFAVGAELATLPSQEAKLAAHMQLALDARTAALEAEIDRLEAELPPLKAFILPAGTPPAAALHVARAVCRRAERRVVELSKSATVRPEILRYLNRLSDLLFVLARYANHLAGVPDTPWRPSP